MNLNWKRILILIGFIAAVILIAYLLYFFFLKPTIPVTGPGTNINGAGGILPGANINGNIPVANINGALPTGVNLNINAGPAAPAEPTTPAVSTVANGGLTKSTALTAKAAYQPTLAQDGNSTIYYDRASGLFYKITSDGKSTLLSDEIFYNVENITWAPNKQKAVLEYPDDSNIVYDFNTKQQVTLPKHWKDFSFSPDSNQIVLKSMGLTEENRWLAVSNSDGSKAQKIELLGDKDATVDTNWSPNNQIIAMYREDIDFDRQNLYFVGLNNENFKGTITEGRGFEGQWSTKGDRLLYSVYSSTSGYRPTLWIVEASGENIGQNRRNLGLETWADKCTFSNNDSVYCAVPKSLQEGSGIFSDELDNVACDIYKIDLKTGFKSRIAIPEGEPNIEDIMVTANGSYLYYTDKNTGRLYQINLK